MPHFLSTTSVSARIWRLASLAALVVIGFLGVLTWELQSMTVDRRELVSAEEVEQQLRELGEALLAAENGQRGYLLTHDPKYLDAYDSGIAAAPKVFQALRAHPFDAATRGQLETAIGLASAKLAELGSTVELENSGHYDAALNLVASHQGRLLMTDFQAARAKIVARQAAQLTRRRQALARSLWNVEATMGIGGLAAVLLLYGYAGRTTRRLGRPMADLVAGIRSVSLGSAGATLDVVEDEEIAAVATALNAMSHRLLAEEQATQLVLAELQRANATIQDSERRFRAVVDNTPAMISFVDAEERFRFINEKYCQWLGVTAEAVLGRTVREVHGEGAYRDFLPLREALSNGQQLSLEREIDIAGTVRRVFVTLVPQRSPAGELEGFFGFSYDITDRHEAAAALRASEERLQMVTANLPGLVSHLGTDLRYRFANQTYREWFGVDPASLIGKHVVDLYGVEVFAAIEGALRRALAGETVAAERELVSAGVTRHCHVVLTPQRSAQGDVIGIFAMHMDISERKRAELALRASESFLARTGAVAGVGGWQLDLRDNTLTWSGETRRLHEVADDFVPTVAQALDFYAPGSKGLIENAVKDCIALGQAYDLELELVSAGGRHFWARATGAAEYEDGKVARLVGAFQDVTEHRRVERELAESYELVRVTLESIGDAVITTDEAGRIAWLNPVAEKLTGWTTQEARGRALDSVYVTVVADSGLPAACPVAACLGMADAAAPAGDRVLVSRTGETYDLSDSASTMHRADGRVQGAVLVFRDVSERRRTNREVARRAKHDALTGLVNRPEFEERCAGALLGPGAHALLFIDLDQFKVVNDSCGHAAGDQVLCQVSAVLLASVHGRDTVARLGGDEFGLLLENCTLEQGQAVAQRICDQMEVYRFVHGTQRYRIGASVGVVPLDGRWADVAAAMHAVDSCCYAAKESGRNRVQAWVETDLAMQGRQDEIQWASRIGAALDEDRFVLFAQRIEPTAGPDGHLRCEVLVRLREADGALVLPGEFLPAVERFKLASRLDLWVVRRAIQELEAAELVAESVDMLSINLSGQSIGDRAFHREVLGLLRAVNFDLRKLCFEITETAAITNLGHAAQFVDEVRGLGVQVALDDFGAGASSFGYLRILSVDYLKIDGQFVTGLLEDPLNRAAVRGFCDVAKVVGLRTVAEYVEVDAVRRELGRMGVDFVQGYLLHRPGPLSELLCGKNAGVGERCGDEPEADTDFIAAQG